MVVATLPSPRELGLPAWVTEYRDPQVQAVLDILAAYDAGQKLVMVNGPVGCLAGDTKVGINRGGKGWTLPLSELVAKQNGGPQLVRGGKYTRGPSWNLDIPTRVQCARDDVMRLGALTAAYESGLRETFTLTTESGRSIRATATHPFMTTDGWKNLGDLHVGDKVQVMVGQGGQDKKKKLQYRQTCGLKHHPYRHTRTYQDCGWNKVAYHRLVVEAAESGLSTETFIDCCREGDIEGLVFLDPKVWTVHHKDGDSKNNDLSNLEVVDVIEHHREHALDYKWKQVMFHLDWDVIESMQRFGLEQTYDLTMADEPHNFIANEFVVHNSGKSLVAEMVRLMLRRQGHSANTLYVCSTKSLQNQFLADFKHAQLLMGRANYPTVHGPDNVTCADCTLRPSEGGETSVCLWCPSSNQCPYRQAQTCAAESELAVLNTSYLLATLNHVKRSRFRGRDLCVIDECDLLEPEMNRFMEMTISAYRVKQLGVGRPQFVTKPAAWAKWLADEVAPAIDRQIARLPKDPTKLHDIRSLKTMSQLKGQVAMLAGEVAEGNWVFDGYKEQAVKFRPIHVDRYVQEKLWRHADKWLLMSGTIISPDELADTLGWQDPFEVVSLPMTFPVGNRPIHVAPVADMTAKLQDTEWPKMVTAIDNIADMYPNDRILVHCVSYKLASYLYNHVRVMGRDTYTYANAAEREKALADYRANDAAILFAPSLDRGVSLDDDQARVIVVAKIPFGSLGDKCVQAKLHGPGGQLWYATNTVRSLIQMCGRGVRHSEDFCETFICDAQFIKNVWKRSRHLLPGWWTDALNMGFDSRALMKRVG